MYPLTTRYSVPCGIPMRSASGRIWSNVNCRYGAIRASRVSINRNQSIFAWASQALSHGPTGENFGVQKARTATTPKTRQKALKVIFAENLTAAMAGRRMSQGAVSRATGGAIHQTTVGRHMKGEIAADLDSVEALAKAVGFDPWQLMFDGFDPSNPPIIPDLTEDERSLYDKLLGKRRP